jgi:hypothetical protein
VFDINAASQFHLPWEFQGGAAWVRGRVEAELDLLAYSSIAAYPLVSTSQPAMIYTDFGMSQTPSISTRPFSGFTSESNAVYDVSAGGHVRLLRDRELRLHGGVTGNRSPVGAQDNAFDKVDLLTFTIGVSGSLGGFQFAAGFNHQTGTAHDVALRNLLDGGTVTSPIDVRMTGFIYSLAYKF